MGLVKGQREYSAVPNDCAGFWWFENPISNWHQMYCGHGEHSSWFDHQLGSHSNLLRMYQHQTGQWQSMVLSVSMWLVWMTKGRLLQYLDVPQQVMFSHPSLFIKGRLLYTILTPPFLKIGTLRIHQTTGQTNVRCWSTFTRFWFHILQ